jgi:hypothetical protein
MERINEFQLYELAISIHPLTQADQDTLYSVVWYDWWKAAEALEGIFRRRALEFCTPSANELYAAINAVVARDMSQAIQTLNALSDPESPIGWRAFAVREAANKFETILSAELSASDTYWISPKGTHKTSVLMSSASLFLPTSTIAESKFAADDFNEAGRCWLFDNYTAAGFHLMRGTETLIRKYYKAATGIEPAIKFRNWGAYLKNLEKCPQADMKIVSFLRQIKDNYRNPILHPEENLTSERVQILFGVCSAAASMLAEGIGKLTATGEQLSLTGSAEALE